MMMRERWTRRALGALVLVFIVALSVQEFHEFFFRDKGLEFYRRQPWLLAVCLAIGILGGIVAQCWQSLSKRMRNRSGATKEE